MDAASSAAGSFKASSEVSSQGRKSLTPEQKDLLLKSRVAMFFMIGIFVAISIFEIARVVMCILLLAAMGILSCFWEEESYIATSEAGPLRRARSITCQLVMVIFPIGLSGWMSYILFAILTRSDPVPFTQEELDTFATPSLLTASQ